MEDFIVVKSHPDLLSFVDMMQKKNAEALSFYPSAVFEREAESGRLYLALLNGEPCGYIYRGASPNVKCHQVCIDYSLRRQHYGKALVHVLESDAIDEKANCVSLRCGFDLEANDFWQSLGYHVVDIQQGGARRQRKINVWRKPLALELFSDAVLEPATGKTSSTLWRKNKQTGIVNQFSRGKKLKDYQQIITKE